MANTMKLQDFPAFWTTEESESGIFVGMDTLCHTHKTKNCMESIGKFQGSFQVYFRLTCLLDLGHKPKKDRKHLLTLFFLYCITGDSRIMMDLVRHNVFQQHLLPTLNQQRKMKGGSAIRWAINDIMPRITEIHDRETSLRREKKALYKSLERPRKEANTEDEKRKREEKLARKRKRLRAIPDEEEKCLKEKRHAIVHNFISNGRFKVMV